MVRSFGRGETSLRALAGGATALVLGAFVLVVLPLAWESASGSAPGALSSEWNPGTGRYGLLPLALGMLLIAALALAMAAPVSILAAIWIVDLAPRWVRPRAHAAVDVCATIPGVVYGVWGRSIVVPVVREAASYAGADATHGFGLLSSSIVLAAMLLPTITAQSCGVLRAVPESLRETAIALGATRWEALRHVVLPAARAGLVGAVALGLTRAASESVAVEMVCGSSPVLPTSVFSQTSTLGVVLLDQYVEATGAAHRVGLARAALVLAFVAVLVGVAGRRLVGRVRAMWESPT